MENLENALISENIQKTPYPEHPDRCQSVNSKGQCWNLAVPNGTFCLVHGGNKQIESQKAANLKNYRVAQWQSKINRFAESSQVKSLSEEIGILRMLMEERLTLCNTPMELMLHSGVISDLVMKIEKVVASCHKLEASLGQHMDKTALMGFAQQVIQIISITVTDRDTVEQVANGIINLLVKEKSDEKT